MRGYRKKKRMAIKSFKRGSRKQRGKNRRINSFAVARGGIRL